MSAALANFRLFLNRMGIALLLFSLFRILFWWLNRDYFSEVSPAVFGYGLRFDLSAIAFLFAPFILLHLLPFPFREKKRYQLTLKVLFHLANSIGLVLNGIDLEYFKFTLKRSTADLFELAGFGNDLFHLMPSFIRDYWYVVLAFFVTLILTEVLYRWVSKAVPEVRKPADYIWNSLAMVLGLGLCFLAARGGWQLKPLDIINASQYSSVKNIPLILNTPFTVMKTIDRQALPEVKYFPEDQLADFYNPHFKPTTEKQPQGLNVVVLIMESMASEYIGSLNPYPGYTPVLDSLMDHSLVFTQCFANGRKSIEGVPAILAGLPTLMNNPLITSIYASNPINSLANLLENHGYRSSFFHGGNNGTMGFDGFASSAGFDRYVGRNEYPNEGDFDGNWGIFDEEFFQFYAQELAREKQPFVSTFFSLSSHHPYTIPKKHEGRFTPGSLPIHQAIRYTDYALGRFLATASKMPWYKNTLFVLTADHASYTDQAAYDNLEGLYAIPLLFFHPGSELRGKRDDIAQQTDILPSVLDYLALPEPAIAFGRSLFRDDQLGYSLSYRNAVYQWIEPGLVLQFDGNTVTGVFNRKLDPALTHNLVAHGGDWEALSASAVQRMKACIQSYNTRMKENRLTP